jgi:hypothetical protein
MLALKPAPKSCPTPPTVILSVVSRFFPLPESVSSRFPVGTRSRRISLRIRRIGNASREASAHFASKSVGICTYKNRGANARKISTCKISRLKTVQNQHLQKKRRGRAISCASGDSRLSRGTQFASCDTKSQGSRVTHFRMPASPVECALTQKRGGGWAARRSTFRAFPRSEAYVWLVPHRPTLTNDPSQLPSGLRASRARGWGTRKRETGV